MEQLQVSKPFSCFPFLTLGTFSTRSSPPNKSLVMTSNKRSGSTREKELREVFRRFDEDGDGMISALELRSYFASIGEYMSHEEAEVAVHHVDTDGDNLISFNDFVTLMKREGSSDADLKAAFGIFEVEKGSGRINPGSLQRVLSKLGDSRSYDECAAMIQVFDADGSGELDFHEFQQMMMD